MLTGPHSRLMDMLLSINECPNVPAERRIDLNTSSVEEDTDDDEELRQKPTKALRALIEDVPHESYDEYVERFPEVLEEISPKDPELYPTSFLSADDIDNYLAELDARIGLKSKPVVPPAAQSAGGGNGSSANFALRNPTSVYNWLRKHAPKTFLQDLEKEKEKDKDHDHGDKGEGSGKRKGAKGKRQSAASRKEAAEGMEFEEEAGYDAQNLASIRGKRKRGDDDGGYRPKGGASRPTKKRKSRDLGSNPPKSRKSAGFAD